MKLNRSIEELIKARKQKYEVRKIFNHAVRTGKIKRSLLCSLCGKTGDIRAHHEDYSKPLEVIWLCSKCHGLTHKKKNTQIKHNNISILANTYNLYSIMRQVNNKRR